MKKVIILILVIALAYLAYNHFTGASLSPEAQHLKQLEKNYRGAMSEYRQAARMSGVSGMDITFDVTHIAARVEGIIKELKLLKPDLTDDALIKQAEEMEEKMTAFLQNLR